MITKESETIKKCCLYASDYHLEMKLLPYIKEKINKVNFVIITENNLEETMEILLDRINLDKKDKEDILNLNWKQGEKDKIKYIESIDNINEIEVIVKGNYKFVNSVNEKIELLDKNIKITNCFCITDDYINIDEIKGDYTEFINTKKI